LLASGAVSAALAQPQMEPPVAVRVNNLPHHVRERVRAHADQGITALARYLELTRTVHQLRLMDVLAGYDRSSFVVDGAFMTERQIEEAVREGKVRPIR
jgi:hypothetical protein